MAADAPAAVVPGDNAEAALTAIAITGYLDTSYNHLSGDGVFTSGVPDRVFDTRPDGVSIQQAAVTVGYQPKEGFGALANVTLGEDADVIRSYGSDGNLKRADLTQAYFQYATTDVTLLAGKFVTLAGAEVIASPSDTNFSRSILFGFAVPFTHTGLRATFTPSVTTTLYVGVNNGWDGFKDTSSGKTLEVGAGFAPTKAINIIASGYLGEERVDGLVDYGPEGRRSLIDVVATWNVTEALSLMTNYDWGQQGNAVALVSGPNLDAQWSGLAGYVNYTLTEQWKYSLRAEYFDDYNGYRTGVAQTWREATATLAYLPCSHVELRGELRVDSSNVSSFRSSDSAADASSGQRSVGLEALFKY
jgi:hypothetical protein